MRHATTILVNVLVLAALLGLIRWGGHPPVWPARIAALFLVVVALGNHVMDRRRDDPRIWSTPKLILLDVVAGGFGLLEIAALHAPWPAGRLAAPWLAGGGCLLACGAMCLLVRVEVPESSGAGTRD